MSDDPAIARAEALFDDGYLCSQAVLMAFAGRFGLAEPDAARLAAPFGAGIGRLGRTCGAVSGALMALGLACGHERPQDDDAKERVLELARTMVRRFESLHGTVECRSLLGLDVSDPAQLERARDEAVFDRVCPAFVRDAATLAAELLAGSDC